MKNFMANLTNGTLAFRGGADYIVLCASKLLEDFFRYYHSDLNVSREDTNIFTLILVVKNAIVCYGIYSMFPVYTSTQLLFALSVYSMVFFAGNSVLNFTLIWATFAAVFCFSSPVMTPFSPGSRFVMSVTALLLAPIGFNVPCTVECITDVFLVINMTWYFLKAFLGPIDDLMAYYFVQITAAMIILALDIFFNTEGLIFVTVIISQTAISLILDAYRRRKVVYYVVMIIVYIFCVREQYLIFKNRSANMPASIKIDQPVYPEILTDEDK